MRGRSTQAAALPGLLVFLSPTHTCYHEHALMKKPGITSSRYFTRLFMISGLLASLSLSAGMGLGSLALSCEGEERSEPSSISLAIASIRDSALTNSPNAQAKSQASRHNRTRHSAGHSGVDAEKLSSSDHALSRFSADRDTSTACPSFCFSRPRGRAPPLA